MNFSYSFVGRETCLVSSFHAECRAAGTYVVQANRRKERERRRSKWVAEIMPPRSCPVRDAPVPGAGSSGWTKSFQKNDCSNSLRRDGRTPGGQIPRAHDFEAGVWLG